MASILLSISTHSPTRGLTKEFQKAEQEKGNFNSQPHKGADGLRNLTSSPDQKISTHSPTRGLTGLIQYLRRQVNISTHSPTRGLTGF